MPEQAFIERFLRFCIIGFIGFAIDFGTTWVGKEKLRMNKYLSNSLGFVLASTINFFLNRMFTFQNNNPEILIQFFKFAMVAVVGLGLNNLFVFLFTDKVKLNFYVAKIGAVGIVLFWNFGANNFFTFS
ncbi:MAG: GtrA family protein [Bacteroidia bacterium]|nr:GtrA family protein [Bacteroidia bacterium]